MSKMINEKGYNLFLRIKYYNISRAKISRFTLFLKTIYRQLIIKIQIIVDIRLTIINIIIIKKRFQSSIFSGNEFKI